MPESVQPPASATSRVNALHFHTERETLFNELHARPFPVLATPAHLSQLVLLPARDQPGAEYQHLLELCQRYAVLPARTLPAITRTLAALNCAGSGMPSFPPTR